MAGSKQVPILLKPYEKKMVMFCFKPSISQPHILQGNASLTGAAKGFGRRTMRTLPTTRQSKMINPSSCCTWLLRCKGGDFVGYPLIHCAPWRHVNKDRCNVSRFFLALKPQQVKEAELHVCPLIEEDTHHVKFTNVSHATFMVELCEKLAARLNALDIGDDSNADEPDLAATEEKEKPIAVPVPDDVPSAKAVGEKRQHTLSAVIAPMASVEEKKAEALKKKPRLTYKTSQTLAANM